MQIFVNGDPLTLEPASTVSGLLERMNLVGKRIALEHNGAIVPRSAYPTTRLQEQDRVEIVQAIGGG